MTDQHTARLHAQLARLEQTALATLQRCTTTTELQAWKRRYIGHNKRKEPVNDHLRPQD